ncbi:MAG: MlaD family protein [Pseudomonadota bacterium]
MTRAGFFETLVGVFVVVVAIMFMVYAYGVSGANVGRDAYSVDAIFGRVDGVTLGSEVRIAGMKVGAVSGHTLDQKTYEARLKLSIASDIKVPEDSVAKIVSDGVLGGAHVAIEPGASDVMLIDGEAITITQGSVDLLGLAVQAFTNQSGKSSESADPLGDL